MTTWSPSAPATCVANFGAQDATAASDAAPVFSVSKSASASASANATAAWREPAAASRPVAHWPTSSGQGCSGMDASSATAWQSARDTMDDVSAPSFAQSDARKPATASADHSPKTPLIRFVAAKRLSNTPASCRDDAGIVSTPTHARSSDASCCGFDFCICENAASAVFCCAGSASATSSAGVSLKRAASMVVAVGCLLDAQPHDVCGRAWF
mmetsp:Transcript_13976/g.41738  ORF Transcript_13976/g.41738 Transcript_13976/m.41738 type:complete len:213 (+) Transcript_13976:1-639(+)